MSIYEFWDLVRSVYDNPDFDGYILRSDNINLAKAMVCTIRKHVPNAEIKRKKGEVYVRRVKWWLEG